jgi:hypothetical protein
MEVLKTPEATKTARFIQILEDGSEFDCELPIADNFNDGTGVLFYKNKGFVPYDVYMDEKNQKAVKAKRDADAKKGDK